MPLGEVQYNTNQATYSISGYLDDGEGNYPASFSVKVEFQGLDLAPDLTEPQKDQCVQDLLDYLSAYPGLADGSMTGGSVINAGKQFLAGQVLAPTEEPS